MRDWLAGVRLSNIGAVDAALDGAMALAVCEWGHHRKARASTCSCRFLGRLASFANDN